MFLIIFTLLLTLLVFIILRILFYFRRIHKGLEQFSSMPGLPFVGNYYDFSSYKLILPSSRKLQEYGTLVRVTVFGIMSVLQVTDIKMIEFLLSTTKVLNKTIAYNYLNRWLGTGLLTSDGDKWRKTRKIITPAFHFQILETYVDVFHSAGETLVRKLRENVGQGPFDVYPYVTLCTLDIICETAMGTTINAQENSTSSYVRSVKEMCRIIVERTIRPWKAFPFIYWFSEDYGREKECLKILHGHTNSVIRRRKDELAKSGGALSASKRKLAFLDLLLQSKIDDRPMTHDEIRQEVDTFMFEGHDTTASGISFTLYCLSTNPEVQNTVVEELNDIFGEDKDRPANYNDLQRMKYLDMVIKESLRLYPPVPFFGRTPDKYTKFHDGVLPPHAMINIFALGVHMDPNNFPDPEKFDPQRFTLENQMSRSPFSYLTFSAGPRNCIGQKFAMIEMKSTISHILRNFVIEAAPDYKPELVPLTVLKSQNGIMLKLEERR